MNYRLAIIGGGNMGWAILRGGLDAGVLRAAEVLVVEPDDARRAQIEAVGVATATNGSEVADAEQILLAVKPQVFPAVAREIGRLAEPRVIISIMAGLSSAAIQRALGDHARVVRIMPNTPSRIGFGMSAIALGAGATEDDMTLARRLFEAIGEVVDVEESQLYAVTAVSGSGPAYVFLLAEAVQQAAEQMGLPHRTARILVEQTIRGAGELLARSNHTATELRRQVTSPGGTTAAALEVMFEKELPEIVVEALQAARDRGIELDQT